MRWSLQITQCSNFMHSCMVTLGTNVLYGAKYEVGILRQVHASFCIMHTFRVFMVLQYVVINNCLLVQFSESGLFSIPKVPTVL